MSALRWFEAHPPRGQDVEQVTAALRPLATRAKRGVWRTTPPVVFELWLRPKAVRWLVGIEEGLATALSSQIITQLPGLILLPVAEPGRTPPESVVGLRIDGQSATLRTDLAQAVSAALRRLPDMLGRGESVVVQWVVGPTAPGRTPPKELRISEVLGWKGRTPTETDTRRLWALKRKEPLFAVRGSIGVVAATPSRAGAISRQAHAALSLANGVHTTIRRQTVSPMVANRLIDPGRSNLTWSGILNASELAVLTAWPGDASGPGFGPPPRELLVSSADRPTTDRVLGASSHPAHRGQLVRMPVHSSQHHIQVSGPTGSGKSTELALLILADAAAGHGVLVIEPKGDLVADVIARLPRERHADLVLIEPSETGAVVGFNPLAGPREQAERRADELLGLFRELFGTAIGPRTSDVLLHALVTAARLPDACLTDVGVLLTNAAFRRRTLAQVSDPLVLGPFWAAFEALSDAERGQVIAPVLNKLRVVTSRASLRQMLGQPAARFRLDDLFSGRGRSLIVLVNLNRGLLGPEAARLLGSLLLQQTWQSIQRRSALPSAARRPVSIVIDEFQDFVGALDFGDVLAQSRGLGVAVTVAHQHLAQLTPSLRAATLANARSRLVFRPAQDDARALAAALGGGLTAEDLERLGAFEACARVLVNSAPSQPFALRTLLLPPPVNDVAALRRAALARYGVNGAAVDEALRVRWHGPDPGTDGPIGVARRRPS